MMSPAIHHGPVALAWRPSALAPSLAPLGFCYLRTGAILGAATIGMLCSALPVGAGPILTTAERARLSHEVFLEARRQTLATQRNVYAGPAAARVVEEAPAPWAPKRYRWNYQTRATVFWVGEKPTARNPVSNVASSWDPNWEVNFGGYDHPFKRDGYLPAGFEPNMNPFYIALPYNDLMKGGEHRPEAPEVIPWFWREYRGPGISVCEDRWIAIHYEGKVCFAQWKDVGPFSVDDWRYVFGGERPRPNPNQNAGIDVSPAVRDFLGLDGNATVDWRFVEDLEVPRQGPWARWLDPDPEAANHMADAQ